MYGKRANVGPDELGLFAFLDQVGVPADDEELRVIMKKPKARKS